MPAPLAAGLFAKIGGGKMAAAGAGGRVMPSILGRSAAGGGGGGMDPIGNAVSEATNWFESADPGPSQTTSEWNQR